MVAIGIVAIAAAVCAEFSSSLNGPFIFDDAPSIVDNQSIRRIWPLWESDGEPGPFSRFRSSPVAARPVVNLSFALNYKWSRLDPAGYRRVNIGLHIAAALLLWAVISLVLSQPFFLGRFGDASGRLGFLIALVWALHPLNTEAVTYITQRTELLVSLFYLAVIYSSLRFWNADTSRSRAFWCFVAAVSCWAGAASKEIMATAPVMVLFLDRMLTGTSVKESLQRSVALYAGLFSSWMLTIILQGGAPHSDSAGFGVGVSPVAWWLTQSKVLLMYLRLAIWPWPLSAHYEPPYLTSLAAAWPYVVPVALLVVVALVLLWRRSAVGYLLSFALAILAPTLLVPIATEIAAERRMYLPLAALLTLVVTAAYLALQKFVSARASLRGLTGVGIVLATVYCLVSSARLQTFNDELALWRDVVAHDPANATAHYNVGTTLLERGVPADALAHFQKAIELRPDYARAYHNLGSALGALGRRDEATRAFEKAVELEPRYSLGHVKLGLTALEQGDKDEARRLFEKAIQVSPHDAEAHAALADLLLSDDDLEGALPHARAAVASAPGSSAARNLLGATLARQQLFTEAIEHLEAAVELDPASLQSYGNLMGAYAAARRPAEAQAAAARALELARAAGDDAMVEQINAFLDSMPQGAATQEATDAGT